MLRSQRGSLRGLQSLCQRMPCAERRFVRLVSGLAEMRETKTARGVGTIARAVKKLAARALLLGKMPATSAALGRTKLAKQDVRGDQKLKSSF